MFGSLNNREISIVIWIIVLAVFLFTKKEILKAFSSVVKALLARLFIYAYSATLIYIVIMIGVLHLMNIWNVSLLKNTVIWIFFGGFVMLFKFIAYERPDFIKEYFKLNINLLILMEFIINLYVFNLLIELLFVPLMVLLSAMHAFADTQGSYEAAKKFLDKLLILVGIVLVAYFIYNIISNFESFIDRKNMVNFSLPIIFSILFFPFVYLCALFYQYNKLFNRMPYFINEDVLLNYTKRKIIFILNIKLNTLIEWGNYFNTLSIVRTKDVDIALNEFIINYKR